MKFRYMFAVAFLALVAGNFQLASAQESEPSHDLERAQLELEIALQKAKQDALEDESVERIKESLAIAQAVTNAAEKRLGNEHPEVQRAKSVVEKAAELLQELQPLLQVYRLRYVPASSARSLVTDILGEQPRFRVAVDERMNSLIVQAPRGATEHLRELLQAIDVAGEKPREIQLTLPSEDAAKRAVSELRSRKLIGKWSAMHDGRRSLLTLTAESPEKLDELQAELARIEEELAPKSRIVRVVWLMSDLADPRPLPSDMKPVVEELEKQGIHAMSVAAQTSVRTLDRFDLSCLTNLEPGTESTRLAIEGTLESNGLSISLLARRDKSELARISTVIRAPLGHPVVLGVSPINAKDSAFVVIVHDAE